MSVDTMKMMNHLVKIVNTMLKDINFDVYLENRRKADTILPILDPTFYNNVDHAASREYEKLILKYKDIQDFIKEMEKKHGGMN